MSTSLECSLIEVRPQEWMIVLEDGSAPKQSWDWREYATSYGMFASEDEAYRFLFKNFANPGGSSSSPYRGEWVPDDIEQQLIEQAATNKQRILNGR